MLKAVILAGGVRASQEVDGLPRSLWPFPTESLLAGVIRFLQERGVEAIAICANGHSAQVKAALADAFTNIHYAEDRVPRGPAGCIRDLQAWIGDDSFLVVQGTGHFNIDLNALLTEHAETKAAITVAAKGHKDALEPAGIYAMSSAVFGLISDVGFQDIKEQLLPKAREAKLGVRVHRVRGSVHLIHTAEQYLAALPAAITAAHHHVKHVECGYECPQAQMAIHTSAKVHPSARLVGPVWVDADVTIDANAIVVGPAIIGAGSHVGMGAFVHGSVLLAGSAVGSHAHVHNDVIAPGEAVGGQKAPVTANPTVAEKKRSFASRVAGTFFASASAVKQA
jgi:NDP-sugar pyrophosphorylase family protein